MFMSDDQKFTDLEGMLDLLERGVGDSDCVSIGKMTEVVGRRSFGPLLLFAGIIAVSPLSGIPGMPTLLGCMVILIASQLLLQRDHFWLPRWILKRSVSRGKFEKAIRFFRPLARFVDRFLRPRLTPITHKPGNYLIALLCILIAATMPPLEVLPFAATTAGAALTTFGLSLIAHDGLLALIALLFTAAIFGIIIYSLA